MPGQGPMEAEDHYGVKGNHYIVENVLTTYYYYYYWYHHHANQAGSNTR